MMFIHDPIQGSIDLSARERKLVDSAPFQRLRYIKQLGFTDLAFPGATHTRYAHSLGAMAVVDRMLERVLAVLPATQQQRERFRQCVRLAVLFHDIGHAPLSHVAEKMMPPLADLELGEWQGERAPEQQASHEDYTVKLLLNSELSDMVEHYFAVDGITPARLVALIAGRQRAEDIDFFKVKGVSVHALLSQLVSGELDADRMDYLQRDAYYCGVPYGQFDSNWLLRHLTAAEHEGQWTLALQHRAVWGFENFLLARHHMFRSVYCHHTVVCLDQLLARYAHRAEYTLPATVSGYLQTDDIQLITQLRASACPWAQAVVKRQLFSLVVETHSECEEAWMAEYEQQLRAEDIDAMVVRDAAILSKYANEIPAKSPPLMVFEKERGRLSPISQYTPLYRRFSDPVRIWRVYCAPQHHERARHLLQGIPLDAGAVVTDVDTY